MQTLVTVEGHAFRRLWFGRHSRARRAHTYSISILRSKMVSMVSSTFELCLRAKRHLLQATVTTHTSILVFQPFISPFQDPWDFFLQLLQIVQSNICCSIFLPFILSGIAVYQDFDLSVQCALCFLFAPFSSHCPLPPIKSFFSTS